MICFGVRGNDWLSNLCVSVVPRYAVRMVVDYVASGEGSCSILVCMGMPLVFHSKSRLR